MTPWRAPTSLHSHHRTIVIHHSRSTNRPGGVVGEGLRTQPRLVHEGRPVHQRHCARHTGPCVSAGCTIRERRRAQSRAAVSAGCRVRCVAAQQAGAGGQVADVGTLGRAHCDQQPNCSVQSPSQCAALRPSSLATEERGSQESEPPCMPQTGSHQPCLR